MPLLSRSGMSYNGGNGELFLLSVLEEGKDIIPSNDTSLASQDVLATHIVLSV